MFSIEDLQDVITKAIQEREEQLRIEYDTILAQRQQEQFQTFAKFNDDYIVKKKATPESYVHFHSKNIFYFILTNIFF